MRELIEKLEGTLLALKIILRDLTFYLFDDLRIIDTGGLEKSSETLRSSVPFRRNKPVKMQSMKSGAIQYAC